MTAQKLAYINKSEREKKNIEKEMKIKKKKLKWGTRGAIGDTHEDNRGINR